MLTKRIQISSERVAQQLGNLWDDRDVRPQNVQVELARRNTVVDDISLGEDASEQRKGQRTFSAPSTTDDTDTFTGLDVEVEAVENFGTVGAVFGRQVLNNKLSAGRPIGRRDALRSRLGFLLDTPILQNSLQARCPIDQNRLSVKRANISYLFPLTSNSLRHLTHHMIILLNPTAMFNEKPTFAADPGSFMAPVPYTK